ncbi:hypothetical protein V1278_002469 [Bradyrhizobium sp. AZCC 1577]
MNRMFLERIHPASPPPGLSFLDGLLDCLSVRPRITGVTLTPRKALIV